jgi:hypothetical protein
MRITAEFSTDVTLVFSHQEFHLSLLFTFILQANKLCMVSFLGPTITAATMKIQSTASSSRCRTHTFPGLLLVLCCLTGAVLAQTFQYSRGWTNGRKRSGSVTPVLIPSSASGAGLIQNIDEPSAISNPCSQLQRIRFLLGARNPQQVTRIFIFWIHFFSLTP